jgi:hypothetical protein
MTSSWTGPFTTASRKLRVILHSTGTSLQAGFVVAAFSSTMVLGRMFIVVCTCADLLLCEGRADFISELLIPFQ